MLDVAGAAQQLHKVLVVGDDQELEVPLSGAALDDSGRASDSEKASDLPKMVLRPEPVWVATHSTSACARDSMLSRSRLVVGSSRARIPQFRQKVSARARRMMREARTCTYMLRSEKRSRVPHAHPEPRTQNTWYLLTSAAAPPHVQSGVALHHDHSVVVDPPLDAGRRLIVHVRPDLDALDIWRMAARESGETRPEKLSGHYLQLEGKQHLDPCRCCATGL